MVDPKGDNETWVGFWGSIVGAMIVGVALLLSMPVPNSDAQHSASVAAGGTALQHAATLQQSASLAAASQLPDAW